MRHIEFLREARQRQAAAERAYASLSRYFSPNLAQQLAADTDAIDLCGQRREIATVFSDITGFTALVETLEPGVLGPLLNDYLSSMTDIVFVHDGTVAKIIGDALHILFGAPGEQPDRADRAVSCSLALDEYAQSFRERWQQRVLLWGLHASELMPGPQSSAISAEAVSSTIRLMATPLTWRRGWKSPISNLAPAFWSVQLSPIGWRTFAADRSVT